MDDDVHREIPAVHVEFLVGSEGKAHVLAIGVDDLSHDDVGCGFDFEGSWDQILRLRVVGVDVVAAGDLERKRNRRRFGLDGGYDRRGSHGNDGAFRSEFFLGRGRCSHEKRTR